MFIYVSGDGCVEISNMGEDVDGVYKKYNDTLYVHTNPTKNKVLTKAWGNGWSGCTGSKTDIDPQCYPKGRWAFIPDLSIPVTGKVNIWTKKGDSSGYKLCGKYNFWFIVMGIIILDQ